VNEKATGGGVPVDRRNTLTGGMAARFAVGLLVVLSCLLPLLGIPASAAPSSDTPVQLPENVRHAGRWLTDSEGRVLLLHGVDIQAKYPGVLEKFQASDADYLAGLGFSVARIAFTFSQLMPQPGKIDESFMRTLSRVVHLLTSRHIFVLLDFHQDEYGPVTRGDGFPPWATFTDGQANPDIAFPLGYFHSPAVGAAFHNFWIDKRGPGGVGLQERFLEGVTTVATSFRHNPMVLGYDLLNEPFEEAQNQQQCESTAGCPNVERSLLQPFYTKAAKALHTADPDHLLFVEPFLSFDYGGTTSLPAYGEPMNGFSFHPYVMGQVQKAIRLSATNNDALLVTEFGATTDVTTIQSSIGTLDADRVPWIFWVYGGHSTSTQRDAMQAVAEPYPLAVAGSPTHYGFDPSSGTFNLAYTSTPVPGDHLKPDAQTIVEVSPSTYPHGYTVTADGAVVTSRPCSSRLTLRTVAPSVSVTVSPGGGC
jgi:endoglycosylceramidase